MEIEHLFELESPYDLFREMQAAIVEYTDEPNSRLLLFLLFSLNHLREWIAGISSQELHKKVKRGSAISEAEQFYLDLDDLNEFQIVRSLCNRSKHHTITHSMETAVTVGATCDSWCTDSLGQKYYRIDGIDSREIFFPVMRKYYLWFEKTGGSIDKENTAPPPLNKANGGKLEYPSSLQTLPTKGFDALHTLPYIPQRGKVAAPRFRNLQTHAHNRYPYRPAAG